MFRNNSISNKFLPLIAAIGFSAPALAQNVGHGPNAGGGYVPPPRPQVVCQVHGGGSCPLHTHDVHLGAPCECYDHHGQAFHGEIVEVHHHQG